MEAERVYEGQPGYEEYIINQYVVDATEQLEGLKNHLKNEEDRAKVFVIMDEIAKLKK